MIPPTPSPTFSFDTGTGNQLGGGFPADANIAVSETHICVTARAAFACYSKAGKIVSPGPGFAAAPITAQQFFTALGQTMTSVPSGTPTKDGRVIFNQYHKRFFMAFQTREQKPHLLIAVSKTQNPLDGWWTYSDEVNNTDSHDYMRIGCNATHFLISDEVTTCTGTYIDWACTFLRTRHFTYPVADLMAGGPYSRGEWTHTKAQHAAPCLHDSYTTDAFWVHRDDETHVSVWAIRDGQITTQQVTIQPSERPVNGIQLGGTLVKYAGSYPDSGWAPQNAVYRDGRITFVSNDGHAWSGQAVRNAVRLVRLNVSNYYGSPPSVTVEIDRIFGRASADDPPSFVYDYGWPAVGVNANGDIVVGSVRSRETMYPGLRASIWFAGQPDISSSVNLGGSSSPLSSFHMAGACADPSSNGVYLAQQYGTVASYPPTSGDWRIRVVRMLG